MNKALLSKDKLNIKIRHLFERDMNEEEDYVALLYDFIGFISFIMEKDVSKEKFIKELNHKYYKIILQK